MHDGQLEDRLRAALRADGEALPLTITGDELERRFAVRRRARTGRRISLLAAAVGAIALGSLAAASAGLFGQASVGGPERSATPTTAVEPSPAAAGEALSCTTIEPNAADQPPAVLLGAVPGDAIAYGGAVGAYRLGSRADGVEGEWISPDPNVLGSIPGGPPTERLTALASNPDACLVGLVAEAVPFGATATPDLEITQALEIADVSVAPTRVIEFAMPPTGDWLVRVHVVFETVSGVEAWTETYFRVAVRSAAASGIVLPSLNAPPGAVLADHVNVDEPGSPTGEVKEAIAGSVPPRTQYQVDVVCIGSAPLRWSIGLEGGLDFLAAGDQPCDGAPGTRIIELGLPTAELPVVVTAEGGTAWHVSVSTVMPAPSFIPPALRMIETGNTEGAAGAAESFARCVAEGDELDPCDGAWSVLEGARSISVSQGSRLTFGLEDGWQISQARITAAVTAQVLGNAFAPEYSVALVEDGGPLITVPVDLGRGSWIIRVSLNATRGDEAFDATYDLPLVVGE